jgi:hypothetical protein
MRRLPFAIGVAFCLGFSLATSAQDPDEKDRTICDVTDPGNNCPGADCLCVDDSIEITFDGDSQSTLEYEDFATEIEGQDIDVTVITETLTEQVQGWSYGVAQDPDAVTISEANITGTDAEGLLDFGFDATSAEDIETCQDPDCTGRADGGGFISAVVLSFTKPIQLPLERNSIARATYQVTQDVGDAGTLIEISGDLAKKNSPPTSVNVTVGGKSRLWTTAIDGWIKKKGAPPGTPFLRADVGMSAPGDDHPADELVNITDAIRIVRKLFEGSVLEFDCEKAADTDDNGVIEVTDAVYLLSYLFRGEPAPPAPFPDVGQDGTDDSLTCETYP